LPVIECGFLGVPGLPATVAPAQALIAIGPGIMVDTGFDQTILATVSLGQPVTAPAGTPNVNRVLALIDTGAIASCIDEVLAQQLQLPLVNQQNAAGVGGVHVLNQYLAYISYPGLNFVQAGLFLGAQLAAGGQGHQALIGRTMLANTLLVYDGRTGSVKVAI
jgi:hypothetical protein